VRFWKRSASAAAAPRFSLPAMGWPPRNWPARDGLPGQVHNFALGAAGVGDQRAGLKQRVQVA